MEKYTTQLFGEIDFDEEKYRDGFLLSSPATGLFAISFSDCRDKIKNCFDILDRYLEITKNSREAIAKNLIDNQTFRNYFINAFQSYDEYEKYDINDFVNEMKILNISFCAENDKIELTADYGLFGYFNGKDLCIKMDEQLNVIECDYKDCNIHRPVI